jgi:F420-dependent oxidoreductase-like protein
MRIGLQIPRFHWAGSPENIGTKLAEIAQTADQSGFASIWVMDHFFQVEQGYGAYDEPMLEAYTALSYMAGVTEKVKLGTMVTGSFYRNPGILVKTVTTLDVLSGGRAMLGIGSGWYRREAEGLGVRFPVSLKELVGRFEENILIAKHMWSDDRSPFIGKYYTLKEPVCSPQPLSKPHPPILIAGSGEKKTLKFVAQYGDTCNFHLGAHPKLKGYPEGSYRSYQTRIDRLTHKMNVLKEHCRREERDYDEIEVTVLCPMDVSENGLSPDEVTDMCTELAGIGVHQVIFNMPNDHEITPIKTIGAEVIPRIKNV